MDLDVKHERIKSLLNYKIYFASLAAPKGKTPSDEVVAGYRFCDKKKPKFFVRFTENRTLQINTIFLMN